MSVLFRGRLFCSSVLIVLFGFRRCLGLCQEVWGGTREEATVRVHDFFASPFFAAIRPIDGSVEAVRRLRRRFRLVIVSSRVYALRSATEEWLSAHFGSCFDAVYLGNHYGREGSGAPKSKPELCRAAGAEWLIDDGLHYCEQVAADGVRAILFDWNGMYSWNHSASAERLSALRIVRAKDWPQIVDILEREAEAPMQR